jgi:hypothetical protein
VFSFLFFGLNKPFVEDKKLKKESNGMVIVLIEG